MLRCDSAFTYFQFYLFKRYMKRTQYSLSQNNIVVHHLDNDR